MLHSKNILQLLHQGERLSACWLYCYFHYITDNHLLRRRMQNSTPNIRCQPHTCLHLQNITASWDILSLYLHPDRRAVKIFRTRQQVRRHRDHWSHVCDSPACCGVRSSDRSCAHPRSLRCICSHWIPRRLYRLISLSRACRYPISSGSPANQHHLLTYFF